VGSDYWGEKGGPRKEALTTKKFWSAKGRSEGGNNEACRQWQEKGGRGYPGRGKWKKVWEGGGSIALEITISNIMISVHVKNGGVSTIVSRGEEKILLGGITSLLFAGGKNEKRGAGRGGPGRGENQNEPKRKGIDGGKSLQKKGSTGGRGAQRRENSAGGERDKLKGTKKARQRRKEGTMKKFPLIRELGDVAWAVTKEG